MNDDPRARREPARSAEWAVVLGVAALVCAILPVVGDWIAVPVGAGAVALGSIGIRVAERDGRPGIARGFVGAMLGLVAVGAALFSVAAGLGHADVG